MTCILIVEDDEGLQSGLQEMLHYSGYEVLVASDAKSGIAVAQAQRPDLVLCDIGLPDQDGFQVLEALRNDRRTVDIPVVFLTARVQPESIREGMALGADDYLCKPVHRQDLLACIKARLNKRTALEQRVQEKVDKEKAAMASRLPHEMRTPLAGILGWAEMLETCGMQDLGPMVRDIGRDIRLSGERLLRMTDRFQLFIEVYFVLPHSGEPLLRGRTTPARAGELLAATAEKAAADHGRSADLMMEIEPGCVPMLEAFVAPVMFELLDNAFKFSRKGQMVIVCSGWDSGRYTLRLTDHGRGMSPEQVRKAGAFREFGWEEFGQQGRGLGLAIVTQVCRLHGGTCRLESTPGESTTITVSLPGLRCEHCPRGRNCPKSTLVTRAHELDPGARS